ncbi:MAG: hypothetical protein ACOYWZ_15705 [Bacillota bacterium]
MADHIIKINPVTGEFNLASNVFVGKVVLETDLPAAAEDGTCYVQTDGDYIRMYDTPTGTWKIFPSLGGPVTPHPLLINSIHNDTETNAPILGDLIVANANPLWSKISGNISTTKKYLTQTGNGTISALPVWDTLPIGVYNELPSGVINGTNKIFTTINNFITGTTRVFLNGLRQQKGDGKDYIESGVNEITFTDAPVTGDILVIDYNK